MPVPREFVLSEFNLPVNCYRHCANQAELKLLEGFPETTACFVCPSGYVSRVVVYFKGDRADPSLLKKLLNKYGEKLGETKDSDIRIATRHPWDMDIETEDDPVVKEVYWTQSYRKSEENPARPALFLCSRCNTLFVQPLNSSRALCEKCQAS
ncbi:MAG: hypothetical protein QXE12_01705 [Conexivisphaerales archaeon]